MPEILDGQAAGLRERKKQRTRGALIDAALELFLTRGYDATTIDEIVAAVDVSQRTFFRYFANKEDVALAFLTEYEENFVAAVAARPGDEPPMVSMRAALHVWMEALRDGDEQHTTRFRTLRRILEDTPTLAAGHLRRFYAIEQAVAAVLADRMGVDPAHDLRPSVLVASFLSVVRAAFEGCARDDVVEPSEIVPRVEGLVAAAAGLLPDAWSVLSD
jgi:AcrR family transcriptional regulator